MSSRKDDPSISDQAVLLRRIPDRPNMITEGGDPTSANFKDREKELSVNLEEKTTIERVLKGHEGFGVVKFPARVPRENSHIVVSDPIVDKDNPENNDDSHCLICPENGLGKGAINRAAQAMAGKAVWVKKPKRFET